MLERETYVVKGTFPSGKPILVNIVAYHKRAAIRTFLNLFCRGKK